MTRLRAVWTTLGNGTPLPAVATPEDLAGLAEVQVVVSADALRGASELPGTVPGVGPVDAPTIRATARWAPWRRLVADPSSGQLVDRSVRALAPSGPAAGADAHSPPGSPGSAGSPGATGSPGPDGPAVLAADSRWGPLLSEPLSGSPLDHGTSRYVPPPALRAHVQARGATCIGAACHHPARGTS